MRSETYPCANLEESVLLLRLILNFILFLFYLAAFVAVILCSCGPCFLLTLPRLESTSKILTDCLLSIEPHTTSV